MAVLAGVPVKPFQTAKERLAATLPPPVRIALSQEMARRTCEHLERAGARPMIVAADLEVASWARGLSIEVVLEQGSDLNHAAHTAVAIASGQPWLLIHADLPLLDSEILSDLIEALNRGQPVIGPSRDGGTPVVGASLPTFAFSYGPLSYHRHLRLLAPAHPIVVVDPRLAIDLDEPTDLAAVRQQVRWMATLLDSLDQP